MFAESAWDCWWMEAGRWKVEGGEWRMEGDDEEGRKVDGE